MRVNGTEIASQIIFSLQKRKEKFGEIKLGILVTTNDLVTKSFVERKKKFAKSLGVSFVERNLAHSAGTTKTIKEVKNLAKETNGIIVQLPLPSSLDTSVILEAIPPDKDIDGVNPAIADSVRNIIPPVAGAINEIIEKYQISIPGKRIVIVGSGRLVGRPAENLFNTLGAVVSIIKTGGSLEPLKEADVIVLGAGVPGLVKPEHLREGVILFDAGTSEVGGKISGDADPKCEYIASIFTPTPGGIGPMAVAMIFVNLLKLAEDSQ